MPHIHLETTSDLPENADVPDILEALVETLCAQDTISSASVKAYHSLRSVWAVGNGHPPALAHCTIMLLEGRTSAQKIGIADAMFETLSSRFAMSLEAKEVAVTMEVREMERDTYRR